MILILLIAVFIYILCTADSTESCIPNEECRTCPFPCDKRMTEPMPTECERVEELTDKIAKGHDAADEPYVSDNTPPWFGAGEPHEDDTTPFDVR